MRLDAVSEDGGGGNRTPTSALQRPRAPVTTTPPGGGRILRGLVQLPADRARREVARMDVHVVLPRVLGDGADQRLLHVLDAPGELAAGLRALDQRDDDVAVDARRALVDVRGRDAATDLLDADL